MSKQTLTNIHEKTTQSESGQALVEYVLLLILVGAIAIGGLQLMGSKIGETYAEISCELQSSDCGLKVSEARQDEQTPELTEEPIAETVDELTPESTEEPVTEIVDEQALEPTATPTTELTDDVAEEPVAEPLQESLTSTTEEPIAEPLQEPQVNTMTGSTLIISNESNQASSTRETNCSATDVPVFEAQCIGQAMYITVTSTCDSVDSANLTLATGDLLDLPVEVTLAKEPGGLTLSTEPILDVGLCFAVDTNTLSVDGTVYYSDGQLANIDIR